MKERTVKLAATAAAFAGAMISCGCQSNEEIRIVPAPVTISMENVSKSAIAPRGIELLERAQKELVNMTYDPFVSLPVHQFQRNAAQEIQKFIRTENKEAELENLVKKRNELAQSILNVDNGSGFKLSAVSYVAILKIDQALGCKDAQDQDRVHIRWYNKNMASDIRVKEPE